MYNGFHVTVHGAGHIRHGQLCEDYSCYVQPDDCQVFVVADGHGDPNCVRSADGSRYICEIMVEQLTEFAQKLRMERRESRLFQKKSASIIRQLISSITAAWYMRTETDLQERPLTEAERSACSDRWLDRYDCGDRIAHIYGTTVIAGVMTERYLLLLHQGDGRCEVFDAQGIVSQPIPWDERCFENITTSMCDLDVVTSFRYHLIDLQEAPITACLLCTDGVEDSFGSMDDMHSFCREVLAYGAQHSELPLAEHLKQILPELSASGSQDDISMAGVFNPEMVLEALPRFDAENCAVAVASSLNAVKRRLNSIEKSGKMRILEQRLGKLTEADPGYANALREYTEYNALYHRLLKKRSWLEENIRRLKNEEEPLPEPDWDAETVEPQSASEVSATIAEAPPVEPTPQKQVETE